MFKEVYVHEVTRSEKTFGDMIKYIENGATKTASCNVGIHPQVGDKVEVFRDELIEYAKSDGIVTSILYDKLQQELAAEPEECEQTAGLFPKYIVRKAATNEIVENCFVLRPDRDPAAMIALRAYAKACNNLELARDIFEWVGQEDITIPTAEHLARAYFEICGCECGDTSDIGSDWCEFYQPSHSDSTFECQIKRHFFPDDETHEFIANQFI